MKAENIFCNINGNNGELSHKLRSVSDLLRHIKTKESNSAANYSIFLGAGASVTSGIRPASELVKEWASELYKRFCLDDSDKEFSEIQEYFESNHSSWYRPEHSYSSLFEKKFDLPIQRRRFVEQEVDGKYPSIGYAYLISLVDNNFFNTIFTTNFDDLVNEAFYLFSNTRPIVCAHDSSINSISITSKRPKIIKLHGDYLFDDIKSTLKETESLEQNTKEKFVEFCKEYGLIVVGYSGGDRSIMDVLEFLVRQENYLKNGVYWCFRREDEVCHALRNLIWKDKVYPVLIDGFDEFFAELHSQTAQKDLRVSSSNKQSKLHSTIDEIVKDEYGLAKNPIIAKEIEHIRADGESKDISDFLKQINSNNDKSKVGLREIRNLLEIDALLESQEYYQAQELCRRYYEASKKMDNKRFYINKYIDILQEREKSEEIILWADKLISTDPNNINYRLKKSLFIKDLSKRIDYLKDNFSDYPYSTELINALASNCFRRLKIKEIDSGSRDAKEIQEYLDKSIKMNPSLSNSAWEIKADLLSREYKNSKDQNKKESVKRELEDLVDQANSQNPQHYRVLELKKELVDLSPNRESLDALIRELFSVKNTSSIDKANRINTIISSCFEHLYELDDNESLKCALETFLKNLTEEESKSTPILLSKLRYWFTFGNNHEIANRELEVLLSRNHVTEVSRILELPVDFNQGQLNKLGNFLKENKSRLLESYYHNVLSNIYIYDKKYDLALKNIELAFEEGITFSEYITSKTYILLLQKKYDKIIEIFHSYEKDIKQKNNEAAIINVQFAAKEIKSSIYNEVVLRNLSAKGETLGTKACAFSILEQYSDARRLIEKSLKKDPGLIYTYKRWPALSHRCFPV